MTGPRAAGRTARLVGLTTIAVSLALGGCSTSPRLTRHGLAAIAGADAVRVVHLKPAPLHLRGGAALVADRFILGGLLGAPIAASAARGQGDALARELGIADPITLVRDRFLGLLKARAPALRVEVSEVPLDTADTVEASAPPAGVDLLLVMQTSAWEVAVKNLRVGYRVLYHGDAWLRRRDGTVLWRDGCHPDVDSHAGASLEELKAENGRRLKERLENAAERCAQELAADFFNDRD